MLNVIMLSVTNKPIILSVVMLSVIMLSVIMLSVIIMKNTYCLFQVKFITEYTNVQHIIITQI
jgi:hypothetical protein